MARLVPALVLALAAQPVLWAQDSESSSDSPSELFRSRFHFSAGYRQDELEWHIASPTGAPNILSELKWDPLHLFEVAGRGSLELPSHHLVVEGSVNYGWITDGDNRDSDYLGNDRTLEFSRSRNRANGDEVLDLSVGGGLLFSFESTESLDVLILGGYSIHRQDLEITDGFQALPPTGPFSGLDSSYDAEWEGPWVGLELRGKNDFVEVALRGEYHWGTYDAEADWNLRPDFQHPKSFVHQADSRGFELSAEARYELFPGASVFVVGDYADFETESGVDQTFFSDGSAPTTRLNVVSWEAIAVRFGITFEF